MSKPNNKPTGDYIHDFGSVAPSMPLNAQEWAEQTLRACSSVARGALLPCTASALYRLAQGSPEGFVAFESGQGGDEVLMVWTEKSKITGIAVGMGAYMRIATGSALRDTFLELEAKGNSTFGRMVASRTGDEDVRLHLLPTLSGWSDLGQVSQAWRWVDNKIQEMLDEEIALARAVVESKSRPSYGFWNASSPDKNKAAWERMMKKMDKANREFEAAVKVLGARYALLGIFPQNEAEVS